LSFVADISIDIDWLMRSLYAIRLVLMLPTMNVC